MTEMKQKNIIKIASTADYNITKKDVTDKFNN